MKARELVGYLPKRWTGNAQEDLQALTSALANILRRMDDIPSLVKFPSVQVADPDANTLDDYEEGTWTPTITAGTGTITTASGTGRYTKIGNTIWFYAALTITTNGTGSGSIKFTLPTTAVTAGVGFGREDATGGKQLQVRIDASATQGLVFNYDNTYPAADGYVLKVSGFYT